MRKKGEKVYTNYKAEDNKNSISSNVIIGMIYFNGDLWISTFDGGLTRLNIKTKKFTQYKNNPRDSNSIAGNRLGPLVIHEGKIWIAIH